MFHKIMVLYWNEIKLDKLDVEDKSEYPYTHNKRKQLVNYILQAGYNVMLRGQDDVLVMLIDDGDFEKSSE